MMGAISMKSTTLFRFKTQETRQQGESAAPGDVQMGLAYSLGVVPHHYIVAQSVGHLHELKFWVFSYLNLCLDRTSSGSALHLAKSAAIRNFSIFKTQKN